MKETRVTRPTYRRATGHSYLVCSIGTPTRQTIASWFEKIPITSVRLVARRPTRSEGTVCDLGPVFAGEAPVGQAVFAKLPEYAFSHLLDYTCLTEATELF